jgi:hypothetical protein
MGCRKHPCESLRAVSPRARFTPAYVLQNISAVMLPPQLLTFS